MAESLLWIMNKIRIIKRLGYNISECMRARKEKNTKFWLIWSL